jgi:type II secretory pathway pseudopilin PulG
MVFERPAQESNSNFCITGRKDENIWEDPSNPRTRPVQVTSSTYWRTDYLVPNYWRNFDVYGRVADGS